MSLPLTAFFDAVPIVK